jgi:uncharacterized lipoprotein YddW (UPF0748 family)
VDTLPKKIVAPVVNPVAVSIIPKPPLLKPKPKQVKASPTYSQVRGVWLKKKKPQ